MADKILAQLGKLDKKWKEARKRANEKGGDFENLPDGKYISKLAAAEINNSESSGRLQVRFEYVIKEGEQEGNSTYKYMGLDKDESLVWVSKELVRLGIDASQLEIAELPATLKTLVKNAPTVRLKLRTKGEYQNCYIEKLIAEDGEEVEAEAATEDAAEAVADEAEAVEEAEAVAEVVEGETEVAFKLKGNDCQSVVSKIDEAKGYMVEVDGKKYWVKPENTTIVEAEAEAVEEEAVEEAEAEAPKGKKPTGKPKPKAEPEEKEVELAIGMKVELKYKGKTQTGPVTKIDETAGMVYVKIGKETVKVKPDALVMVPEGKDK